MSAIPFEVRELATAEPAAALFRGAFGHPPPAVPRHFVAIQGADGEERIAGYVHYTAQEPGVYLCGGLCIEGRIYRAIDAGARAALAREGSLSRWLLRQSIAALGAKRAVFAYTGDVRSRRDVTALGFVPAEGPFLVVQWHGEPAAGRAALVSRIAALGPF